MSEPDPIDTDDPDVLRAEILRLRDHLASIDARIEVLESLIATRDTQITEYDAEVNRPAMLSRNQPSPAPGRRLIGVDRDHPAGTVARRGRPAATMGPDGPVRFSVIVRTQGRRPTSLIAALESIAEQGHAAHQVLVLVHEPDASVADRVRAELEHAGLDLPLEVIGVPDGGRSRPLNVGLDSASGDYVCFLDDDDLALPDWLGAFDRAIQSAPGTTPRARTGVQPWATDGGEEPFVPSGESRNPSPPSSTSSAIAVRTRRRSAQWPSHGTSSNTSRFVSPTIFPSSRTGSS